MKISDTIIGSIIIGVLVGGAILFTGGSGQDRKQAQIKVLAAPHADKGSKKFMHKEITIDSDSDSAKKWHIKSDDMKRDLPTEIADTVEKALNEALGDSPENLDIKIVIKTDEKGER
tara:strand:- start:1121 stop:1471 length:351 start_codon:yes stop_codon:yes gene_type:complete